MNIAIIGAGFTGLAASYRLLKHGHQVNLFERDSHPGGLAVGYKKRGWDWSLEKHYHHFFTNDKSILSLAEELDFPIIVRRPKTSVFINDEIEQLDSPSSLLTFPHLSFPSRIRMAATLAAFRFNPFWRVFEPYSVSETLPRLMGEAAYSAIWEPQMKGKFGKYARDISLAWFWARVYKRTPSLAYPSGGFLDFAEHLLRSIEELGGDVMLGSEVSEIGSKGKPFVRVGRKRREFDAVLVTLPSFPFVKLAPGLPKRYVSQLQKLKGIGAINLVMRLKKPFLPDNTYWLSVCDSSTPIMAVVEHTRFMDKKHYNDEHVVYVGKYAAADSDIFKKSDSELLKLYAPFLEKLHPNFKKEMIGCDVFRAPYAQPIIPPNYSRIIPSIDTPLEGVFLANIQQVYPWDRGTNYAVELGERAASYILEK